MSRVRSLLLSDLGREAAWGGRKGWVFKPVDRFGSRGVLLGEKRVQIHSKPSGFFGTFLVGLAFAAGWTPCIGPILGAILALAAGSSGGIGRGIALGFAEAGAHVVVAARRA